MASGDAHPNGPINNSSNSGITPRTLRKRPKSTDYLGAASPATAMLFQSYLPQGSATLDKGKWIEGGRNTPSFSLLLHHQNAKGIQRGCNGNEHNHQMRMNQR